MTLRDAITDYLAELRDVRRLMPATLAAYRSDLDAFASWCDEHDIATLDAVTRQDVVHYFATLAGHAASTARRHIVALRGLFSTRAAAGVLPANPLGGLQGPRRRRTLPRVITATQARAWVGAAACARDTALLATAYVGGLRCSELAGLDVEDVDLDAGRLTVRNGKGGADRVVELVPPALSAIALWLEERGTAPGALFTNGQDARLSTRGVRDIAKRTAARAGLPSWVSTHTLRHACATHLLAGGAPLQDVQEHLGHRDITTTTLYAHLAPSRLAGVILAAHPLAA